MITTTNVIWAAAAVAALVVAALVVLVYSKIHNDLHFRHMNEATQIDPQGETDVQFTPRQERLLLSLYAQSMHPRVDPQAELLAIFRIWQRRGLFGQADEPSRIMDVVAPAVTRARIRRQTKDRRAVKRGLAVALGGFPPTSLSLDVLERALRDDDSDVRLVAAAGLEMNATPEAAEILIRGLRDRVLPPERIAERLRYKWAVPVCVREMRRPVPRHGVDVRKWLAQAIGIAGDPQAIPALVQMCNDENPETRLSAVRALGTCSPKGHMDALSAIRRMSTDPNVDVRAQAMTALGAIGDEDDIPFLVRGLRDVGWYVRGNAATALLSIGPEGMKVLETLMADDDDPYAVQRAREATSTRNAITRHAGVS